MRLGKEKWQMSMSKVEADVVAATKSFSLLNSVSSIETIMPSSNQVVHLLGQ